MTEKESLTHEIEDDLDRRNRNWNKMDRNTNDIAINAQDIVNLDDDFNTHLAESANLAHGGFKGVLLRKDTEQSIPDRTIQSVLWDSVIYDTSGFFNSAEPTRITIPSGVTKIRCVANSAWAVNTSGARYIAIYKNNVETIGLPMARTLPDTRSNQNITSAVIQVQPNDYFELKAHQDTGTSLGLVANYQTWFSLEVVE